MCTDCSAIVEANRQQMYRLRCMIQLERLGYSTINIPIKALQIIAEKYKAKWMPDEVAVLIHASVKP